MNEQILKINNVEICTESFGNPNNPAVLLIMGAMSSLDWWDEDFCLRLAERERFVIRYDHRDLGRSTTYPPGTSNYTITDMADDAIGVLDAYSIEKAHIVGMSLGGMIGQILALRYPDRIDSLTLIASSVRFDLSLRSWFRIVDLVCPSSCPLCFLSATTRLSFAAFSVTATKYRETSCVSVL